MILGMGKLRFPNSALNNYTTIATGTLHYTQWHGSLSFRFF